ncbi:iron-regulated protein A [Photobacterium sanctipauli]|uniref:Iron-regulated protein A n=1 Tax=Photobacterium sanctipauli TaxID=1342794 RepID=A0A2T3NY10_9GAMM|nr:imelysin family protein [Photobacterium sanctipauli]PSW21174.1 iron-regulated protein A [Photobacterium sanctipauli]
MKKQILASLALLAVGTTAGCQTDAKTTQDVLLVQHQQAAQAFAESTAQLSGLTKALCEQYSEASLLAAQQAWQQAMLDWMVFQGREKGSEQALALSWQIQFWPDKKNTTGRKLNQLLKQGTHWTAPLIAEQSVAVQGLGAAEWFLFDQTSALQQPQGCQLATAVAGQIAASSEQLQAAWQANPWQQMTPQLALAEYLGALNNQLDYSIKKLTRPMGKPGSPKPYQAESWRSGSSLANLQASTQAMHRLYLAEGKGLDAMLRERGYSGTADRIDQQFQSLLASWPQHASMTSMLKTPEGYRELLKIFNGLEYIQIALQDEVAPELGIVVGFNATDGD